MLSKLTTVPLELVGEHCAVRAHIAAHKSAGFDGRDGLEHGGPIDEQDVPVDEHNAQMLEWKNERNRSTQEFDWGKGPFGKDLNDFVTTKE